jgi:hypothetical protein
METSEIAKDNVEPKQLQSGPGHYDCDDDGDPRLIGGILARLGLDVPTVVVLLK